MKKKKYRNDLYTPAERENVRRWNVGSLPRWLRRVFEPKEHSRDQEDARRRDQIASGFLGPSSRGTTEVKNDSHSPL